MSLAKPARILPTKLRPPLSQAEPLARPRLLAGLEELGHYRLGVVHGPAGAGKTTVLCQLHQALLEAGARVGWLSLDRYDNDLHRFLTALLAALEPLAADGLKEAAALLTVPGLAGREVASALVEGLLEPAAPRALILDDYHELDRPEIHEFVDDLLQYLPAHLSLVIGSRQLPPLALARLRLGGWLRELYWQDLRFTDQESRHYLRQARRLALSDAQVEALNSRAEGWIAGLQLAATSLGCGADAEEFVARFAGDQAAVADYLMEDVFRRQPPEVQAFLLRTSVADRLCAPLCDALTQGRGGQAMLERLEQHNLFLFRLDSGRQWYRYHHLFAEFLRNRLQAAEPEAAPRLLGLAAAWLARAGLATEAVGYALRAGLEEEAARLLEDLGRELFYRGEFKELRYWLERLPPERLRARPRLCLLDAWALAYLGEFAPARERLEWAADGEDPARREQVQAEAAVLRVAISVIQADEPAVGDLDETWPERFPAQESDLRAMAKVMLAYALRAEHRLEPALAQVEEAVALSDHGAAPLVNLLARFNQGGLLHLMGRADAAERALAHSLEVARTRRWSRSMGMAFLEVQHAVVLQEQYRLEEACAALDQAIELLERTRAHGFLGVAYSERARLHLLWGEQEAYRQDYQRAAALAEAHRVTRVRFRLALLSARDAMAQGRLAMARIALEPHLALLDSAQACLSEKQEALLLGYVRLLLAEQRRDEALAWTAQALAGCAATGRARNRCEFLLLQARAQADGGQSQAAADALAQALALGEAGGLVAPFALVEPQELRALAQAGQPYAARLLERLQLSAEGGQPAEPLHPRERQILGLLAQGMRNREIGERLFLSEETVKWYLKGLFRKLEVGNRTQAILWARRHGMV